MYFSINDFQFWVYGLLTVVAVGCSWYLPGMLILRRAKLNKSLTTVTLALSVGMVLWGAQGYLFGYMQQRWLTYVYVLSTLLLSIKHRHFLIQTTKAAYKELQQESKFTFFALLVACVIQLLVILPSGLRNTEGVIFYFSNTVDGIMHLSYIQSIANQFPPIEPGANGLQLQNYHYWGDLVTAELVRVWHLPTIHLFFQYVPIVLIVSSMMQTVLLVDYLKGNTSTKVLALFFLTFGSDLSYIFSYALHGFFFMDIPILDNGVTFLFNMPQVFARLILISTIIITVHLITSKKMTPVLYLCLGLLVASQFGFKVYYGIYSVMALFFLTLFLFISDLWSKKHSLKKVLIDHQLWIYTGVFIAILVALIYLPVNKNSGGLVFSPFEWPKLFLSNQYLDFGYWWSYLYASTDNQLKIWVLYAVAVVITISMVHGSRFIGILPTIASYKQLPMAFLILVVPVNMLFISIGMLFFQVSGGFNIFNFFLVPTFTLCFITAFNLSLIQNTSWKSIIIAVVVLLTLPRSISQIYLHLQHYKNQTSTAVITNDELQLLEYIKSNSHPHSVVLADPKNGQEPLTPYMSFFSQRNSYLSGKLILESHNQPISNREEVLNQLFKDSASTEEMYKIMTDNKIDFLVVTSADYIPKINKKLQESDYLTKVYTNSRGFILAPKVL